MVTSIIFESVKSSQILEREFSLRASFLVSVERAWCSESASAADSNLCRIPGMCGIFQANVYVLSVTLLNRSFSVRYSSI